MVAVVVCLSPMFFAWYFVKLSFRLRSLGSYMLVYCLAATVFGCAMKRQLIASESNNILHITTAFFWNNEPLGEICGADCGNILLTLPSFDCQTGHGASFKGKHWLFRTHSAMRTICTNKLMKIELTSTYYRINTWLGINAASIIYQYSSETDTNNSLWKISIHLISQSIEIIKHICFLLKIKSNFFPLLMKISFCNI